MANDIITPSEIAKEALFQLDNNLVFANNVHREYKKEFVKKGQTVSIRKPVKFYAADGATRVNQDVEESNTSITVDKQKHVSWNFSSVDLTLSIEEYSERYIKPAAIALGNTVDMAVAANYKNFWNMVGSAGTTPSGFSDMADIAQRMDEMAVPSDQRRAMLNPAAGYKLADTASASFMAAINKSAYQEGNIGPIAGLKTFRTQNVPTHTNGLRGGTPLVNGGAQAVSFDTAKKGINGNSQTLETDGWDNSVVGALKAGDVINLGDVFAMNPVPGEGSTGKQQMPYLQDFVILEDVDTSGAGAATLKISPAIVTSGPQQTVSAQPADNAPITVKGGSAGVAHPQNMGFHKNAIGLVTVPMELPDGVNFKARETHNGLSIRVIKDYDINQDTEVIRLDILFGDKTIYPDLGVRRPG